MSAEFSDYRVVSLINKGTLGTYYCVEEKVTGRLYVWEAVDYGILSSHGKVLVMEDVSKILNLQHQHLIQCMNCIDHRGTRTLYLVKEYCGGSVSALIRKCKLTNSFVDEAFIWKIIYQVARAAHTAYSRGPPSMHLDLTMSGVHLDDEGNVKLDYWLMFREIEMERKNKQGAGDSSGDSFERRQKKCDTLSLGVMVQSLAVLQTSSQATQQQSKHLRLPAHYSQELQSIINLMMKTDLEKRPTIEDILHHPALLSQVVTSSLQHLSMKDSTTNSETFPVNCTKCKELEEKLTYIRKREANSKSKELNLRERERILQQKEKHVSMLETLVKEKLHKAEVYLCQIRRGKQIMHIDPLLCDEQDSSYSADPGDTSLPLTAAKLDPSKIVRPASLAPSLSSRRSVRFEKIPELEEPTKSQNECTTWLQSKRIRYKLSQTKNSKFFRKEDKENQEPRKEEARNHSVVSLAHSTREGHDGLLETFFR